MMNECSKGGITWRELRKWRGFGFVRISDGCKKWIEGDGLMKLRRRASFVGEMGREKD